MHFKTQYECMNNDCRTVMFGHFSDGVSCVKCGGRTIAKPYHPIKKENTHEPKQQPLLSIVLSDIDAAPVVHYKGEKIDGKIRVSFDWATDTDKEMNTYIHLEHMECDNKHLNTKIIQHNHPLKIEEETLLANGVVVKQC